MADKKEQDRFVQKAAGVEITNIPAANLKFILEQQEREQKEKDKKE